MIAWRDAVLALLFYFTALGLCDPAPAAVPEGVAISSGANRMDRYLTEDEQARLLGILKTAAGRDTLGRRDDAAVRALIHSGLRIGEFLRITVIDALAALRGDYLFIPREHRKGFGKGTARDHEVYVTAPLRRAVEDLLKVRAELFPEGCREDAPLIVGRNGEVMTVRNFQLRYKEHARTAGIARSSPHWLRHTRGQNIMRRSTAADPRGIVQRALGHVSIASTGVYTATPREAVEAGLREVDGLRSGRRVTLAQLRREHEGRAHS
jgi:site-specific recombinase XerC